MNAVLNHFTAYFKAHLSGLTSAVTLVIADLNTKSGLHSLTQWYAIVGAYLGSAALVGIAGNGDVAAPVATVVADVTDVAAPVVDLAQDVVS